MSTFKKIIPERYGSDDAGYGNGQIKIKGRK